MAHIYFINEGIRERMDQFELFANKVSLGGYPALLRPIRMYNWQVDNRDLPLYLNELRRGGTFTERQYTDQLNYKFNKNESDFKLGRLRRVANLAMNVLRPIGIKPVDWSSVPHLPEIIPKPCINTIVLGTSKDLIKHDETGDEEWL